MGSAAAPLRHDGLRAAVRMAAVRLPPGHAEALARALEGHAAPGFYAARAMAAAVPHEEFRQVAGAVAGAWESAFASGAGAPDGPAVALALRVASEVAASVRAEQSVEVVWTGPSTIEVPVRHTPQVIEQLADGTTGVLWLVSFAAYKVPLVLNALERATVRGVDVRLVLETKEHSQGALSHDAADAFASLAHRVSLYVWPLDKRPPAANGRASMHAKAVVSDETAALVTSANATAAALADNMELGLLVRGGSTPRRLARHFQRLVEQRVLVRVPATG